MKNFTCLSVFVFLFTANLLQAQLTSLRGPYGGWVWDMQTNDNYFFLQTTDGIYRSPDAAFWEIIGGLGSDYSVWDLLDVNGPSVLAMSGDSEKMLHISHDNGDTWFDTPLPAPIGQKTGYGAIAGQRVMLCNRDGEIWESADQGLNWVASAQFGKIKYIEDVKGFRDRIYIGSHQRIMISNETGFDYTQRNLPTGISAYTLSVFDSLIVIYDLGKERFYRWYNANTWQASNLTGFGNSRHYVAMHQGALYALHRDGLAKSDNLGLTWKILPAFSSFGLNFIGAVDDKVCVADYVSGAFQTTDPTAGPWSGADYGLANSLVRCLATNKDYLFAGTDYRGLFRYNRVNAQWDTINLFPSRYSFGDIFIDDQNRLFAVADVFWSGTAPARMSTDNGNTWQSVLPTQTGSTIPYYEFNRIAASGQNIYGWTESAQTGFKLFQSSDLGASWINLGFKVFQMTGYLPTSFCFYNNTLFAGTKNGVILSYDNGLSWELKTNGLPVGKNNFSILQIKNAGTLLFAIIYNAKENYRLYRSTDMGENWTPVDLDFFPMFPLYDNNPLIFVQRFGQNLIMNFSGTLYFSADEGLNWARFNGILPAGITTVLPEDSVLYLGTGNRGVWQGGAPDFEQKTVSGRVYWDDNQNSIQDMLEPGAANVQLYLEKYNLYVSTNTQGDFSFQANFGQGASTLIPMIENLDYTICTPAHLTINGEVSGINFALTRVNAIRDLSVWISPVQQARPGFPFEYAVSVRNTGSTIEDALVELTLDAALEFVSAEPAPESISGNTLRWTLLGLDNKTQPVLRVVAKVPADIAIGTNFSSSAVVSPADNDMTPENNTAYATVTTTNAHRAVDISEIHGGKIGTDRVAAGEPLVYTVRFQNTGDEPVKRVVVTDAVTSYLDRDKLQVVASSHPYTLTFGPGNGMEFRFENINLPDSASNEPASQGFISFAIPIFSGTLGSVYNRASVFFDYQPPVNTQNTFTQIIETVSAEIPADATALSTLPVYPNPNAGIFTLDLSGLSSKKGMLEIVDWSGRILQQQQLHFDGMLQCNFPTLASGVLTILVREESGAILKTGRVVIQH